MKGMETTDQSRIVEPAMNSSYTSATPISSNETSSNGKVLCFFFINFDRSILVQLLKVKILIYSFFLLYLKKKKFTIKES